MDAVIILPNDPLSQRVLDFARLHVVPPILNHSIRTFLHASAIAAREGVEHDREVLFHACALHDLGTAHAFDGPVRFEVEGADGAAAFLTAEKVPADVVDQVWEAIALHTSAQIAERRGPITMLTRRGVVADFDEPDPAFEEQFPRWDIERELKRLVVDQVAHNPAKAPKASWAGYLTRGSVEPDDF
ncbi:HD domain-containing protein [Umezawaea tangerina]|uniref:HD domain-containing protein n=1 Tax=Umezawaea tangerina TaxID=84725 RepID=A0A2T0T411_9PSEU|nr:HD domain-containing protein [Umezawaea tangerina]